MPYCTFTATVEGKHSKAESVTSSGNLQLYTAAPNYKCTEMGECEAQKSEMIANYSAFLWTGKTISEIQYNFSFGSKTNHRAMVQYNLTQLSENILHCYQKQTG